MLPGSLLSILLNPHCGSLKIFVYPSHRNNFPFSFLNSVPKMGAWDLNPLPSPGSRSRKDFSFSCIKGGAFFLSSVHRSFINLSHTLKGTIFFPGYDCYSYFPLLCPSSPLLPLLSSSFPLSFLFSFFTNCSPFKSLQIGLRLLLSIQPVKPGTGVDTGHIKIRRGFFSPPFCFNYSP